MEVEKRKRFVEDGEIEEEEKKVKVKVYDGNSQGGKAATVAEVKGGDGDEDNDGEVEEFFAILRRIHVAVKYFQKGKDRNGKKKNSTATATAMPWSPNFEREDFEGGNGNGVKGKETVGDNVGLDLNVEPDPDSE